MPPPPTICTRCRSTRTWLADVRGLLPPETPVMTLIERDAILRIYSFIGLDLTPAIEAAMQAAVVTRPARGRPRL